MRKVLIWGSGEFRIYTGLGPNMGGLNEKEHRDF